MPIPGLHLLGDSHAPQAPQQGSGASNESKSKGPKPRTSKGNKDLKPWQVRAQAKTQRKAVLPPDEKVYPSASSGGIPEPSAAYLQQSLCDPTRLPAPRRILVVMDLNGTLLHRPQKTRPSHFVARPHAANFLKYCLSTFHVAIWSSARPENVGKMVAKLLTPDQVKQCLVIWARDRFGLSHEDYNSKVQVYKRLDTVWQDERVATAHPDAANGGKWDQSNTVLVDDSLEKGRSEPFNILALPEFSGLANEKAEVLPQVHDYLNELSWQADISSYMRATRFALDAKYKLPSQR